MRLANPLTVKPAAATNVAACRDGGELTEDQVYRRYVLDVIEAEWRALGVSEEELRLDELLDKEYARQCSLGRSHEEIEAEWARMTIEEILAGSPGTKPQADASLA
jgi:hypothetical protein